MFFLRTFKLSFAIIWRLALHMPLLVLLYVALGLIGLGLAHVGGGFVLLILFSLIPATIGIHLFMVGSRIGAKQLGIRCEPDFGRTFTAAIGYGLLESVTLWVVSFVTLSLALVFIGELVQTGGARPGSQYGDPTLMPSLLVAHSNLTVFSLLTVIIAFGMRAAFMPVFASSAIGRAPRGLYRTVFTGFGDSLWNNMFVLLFVAAVPAAAVATLDVAVEQFSVIGLLASELPDLVLGTVSGEEISINLGSLVVVIGAALLSLWLFCLQCASAALSFEAASGKGLAQQKRTVAEPKEDIGALLRERMARNQLGG